MADPAPNPRLDDEPSLPEKVIAIHETLDELRIPHALGGALALAYYADPRATIDIDINVFLPANQGVRMVDELGTLGIDSESLDKTALERDGQCRLWWGDNAVDLFFAYDPFHEEMRKQSRRAPFAGMMIPILAPEHLAVCKAVFDRRKDWMDIEQMLIAADDLDVPAIESWLERMVGEDDPRLERLRELKAKPLEDS
jgi:hypothetical protein